MTGLFKRFWPFPLSFAMDWFKKVGPVLASVAVIAMLIIGVNYLRHDFDTPSATQSKHPSQIATTEESEKEKVTINFYLKEHENAVMQVAQADYSTQPSRKGIELGYEDVFYYDAVRGLNRELPGERGVFLRAPRHSSIPTRGKPSRLTDIANGHNLNLQKAQEAVSFKIVAPQILHPGYFLESIRKIEGKECFQLIYTNGVSTLSLFEQAVESKEKFYSGDFREYIMYSKKGDEPVNIIGWNSAEISFTLIGEEDLSHLMGIIRAIQEDYLGNK